MILKNKKWSCLLPFLSLGLLLFPSSTFAAKPITQLESQPVPARPKNIIIMIGDGMGPAYTTAYRYYQDNPDTENIEHTVFDRLLVGMSSTHPTKSEGIVTDSAAAATALSSGIKTYNGAIGINKHKQAVRSIMQLAKQQGMSTGIAVTSQVNHATPAAFLSHNESRRNYDEIALSYLHTDTDVILGGGQQYFSSELIEQFKNKGYQYITDVSELNSLKQAKVLGLFADKELPWAINEKKAHKLSRETQTALTLLSNNPKGFVLLVEGSLIDWAGHSNDIVSAMGEMNEFANAVEVAEQFVRQHPETLLVITADHNTGGLSIGANDVYAWNSALIRGVQSSPDNIAIAALESHDWQDIVSKQLGFKLNEAEINQLAAAKKENQDIFTDEINKIISRRSHTGWTSHGHTGVDVQVFATGPSSALFHGHQDNTDIANNMISLLPTNQNNPNP
ncbi:alkaline phosphatase [Shewanella surugensis]|uniref:Alkaline phosphatase n=1 Tax=Shewanella surugensis TaxID=212020 RepID=A0ABT0L9N7_9GAMM|nr:alkaline phosphatase [Shewanella surugensis]MCL1124062.1 alkaline phosphatase [Shewanella surugensis]